jgi:geranylgeranyl reductase family protein
MQYCVIARMNNATQTFDVIICGAGPSGSTAALCLKDSGLKIALIDKAVFPRDKICGDSVSSVNKHIFRQINPELEKELLTFAPKSNITCAIMHSPDFNTLKVGFKKVGHCIRRKDFDNWLFQKALTNKNVTTFLGTGVATVQKVNQIVNITLTNGIVLSAPIVLGCDGAHSVVAKQLAGFKVDRKHYSGALRQYYRNVKGVSGDALEVYFLKGYLPGYFWIFPLHNNEVNVGFGMLSDTIAKRKIDLKKAMHQIIHQIPQVADRFAEAIPLEEPKGFGLPLGSKKYALSGDGFLLCGDAASLIDPFSGEGIETAIESGKFAAEQVITSFRKNNFTANELANYDKKVYNKMWPLFRNHFYLQKLLGDRVGLINTLVGIGNIPWINNKITKLFY